MIIVLDTVFILISRIILVVVTGKIYYAPTQEDSSVNQSAKVVAHL